MDGVNTLGAFDMYSGIQRNEFTLCVTASAYYKISPIFLPLNFTK